MNEFRLTVHWTQRIVEIHWPAQPTESTWRRCEGELRAAVSRLGAGWKILVDDSGVEVLPAVVGELVAAQLAWSVANGLLLAARVSRPGNAADVALSFARNRKDLMKAAGAPFTCRKDAWAALTAATTPPEFPRAVRVHR